VTVVHNIVLTVLYNTAGFNVPLNTLSVILEMTYYYAIQHACWGQSAPCHAIHRKMNSTDTYMQPTINDGAMTWYDYSAFDDSNMPFWKMGFVPQHYSNYGSFWLGACVEQLKKETETGLGTRW